jgi:hypothetical protein
LFNEFHPSKFGLNTKSAPGATRFSGRKLG